MTPNGPLPHIPGRVPVCPLIIHSGSVTLDIRPLSRQYQTLITTINPLKLYYNILSEIQVGIKNFSDRDTKVIAESI